MRFLPLAEVKAQLSELVSELGSRHDQITVTRNGKPSAVIVSVAEWESLQETLVILGDPQARADLCEAELSRLAGETYRTEQVLADFEARRSQRA